LVLDHHFPIPFVERTTMRFVLGASSAVAWAVVSRSVTTDKPHRTAAAHSMKDPTGEVVGGSGNSEEADRRDAPRRETGSSCSSPDAPVVLPLLPPPGPEGDGAGSAPRIRLGESILFEGLGPVIINSDGTTRRIDNWDAMTPREREVAWRRIAKRNEERRQKLLLQQQEQEQQDDAE
jgi:hypothetical protein